jgi:hypothetical protein
MSRVPVRSAADALVSLEAEINGEKAASMGRVAEKIEAHLAACARLVDELAAAAGPERAELLAAYEEQRQAAKLSYWYLIVQRECIGMYDHGIIARRYPMPPRLA